MSGKPADLCLTVLTRGGGYLPLGQGWEAEAGVWRVRAWAQPAGGRVAVFLPAGRGGTLADALTLHDQAGTKLGGGRYVPAVRGVILQVWAWPEMDGGGCWLRLRAAEGAGQVTPERRRSTPVDRGQRPTAADERRHERARKW